MQTITTIGLDNAKSVFQVHGVEGNVIIRRQLKRRYVLTFFQKLPPCLVGIEACASSHPISPGDGLTGCTAAIRRTALLDMDSSVSPTYGDQEGTAYNGHFACTCYHPLFVSNQFGDLERCALRPGQRLATAIPSHRQSPRPTPVRVNELPEIDSDHI